MNKKPLILVTNDDGINAPGLRALIKIMSDIYINVNDKLIKILPERNKLEIIKKNELNKKENYVKYNIDIRLLSRLLSGPRYAHWQNAEIGSHLNFFRSPNLYDRDLYFSTIYLHQ